MLNYDDDCIVTRLPGIAITQPGNVLSGQTEIAGR